MAGAGFARVEQGTGDFAESAPVAFFRVNRERHRCRPDVGVHWDKRARIAAFQPLDGFIIIRCRFDHWSTLFGYARTTDGRQGVIVRYIEFFISAIFIPHHGECQRNNLILQQYHENN